MPCFRPVLPTALSAQGYAGAQGALRTPAAALSSSAPWGPGEPLPSCPSSRCSASIQGLHLPLGGLTACSAQVASPATPRAPTELLCPSPPLSTSPYTTAHSGPVAILPTCLCPIFTRVTLLRAPASVTSGCLRALRLSLHLGPGPRCRSVTPRGPCLCGADRCSGEPTLTTHLPAPSPTIWAETGQQLDDHRGSSFLTKTLFLQS